MRTLTIGGKAEGARMITRRAYIDTEWAPYGESIAWVQFAKDKQTPGLPACEEIKLRYPNYAIGGMGEARYVHLSSYPDRIIERAHSGTLSN
jgi:hypothetical protein